MSETDTGIWNSDLLGSELGSIVNEVGAGGSGGLYARQGTLKLAQPNSVIVVGVGGVGSWVALNIALVGIKHIVLIDPDTIEGHNLNRTPFKSMQIGLPKVTALAELIFERRPDITVIPIAKHVENLSEAEQGMLREAVIIDCRDIATPLPGYLKGTNMVMGGYDGFKITLHMNPNYESIWGDEHVTYTTVPSYVVPPQLLASLITLYITSPEARVETEKTFTIDIREIISELMGVK